MSKQKDTLSDLAKAIADADTEDTAPEDFVEINGVRYYRELSVAAAPPRKTGTFRVPRNNWVVGGESRKAGDVVECELETVVINTAPYADRITLDNVIYMAGATYDVPPEVATVIRDACANTWRHEASTGGAYSHGTQSSVRGSRSQMGAMSPGIAFG